MWALHSAGAICWKKATSILRKRGEPFSLDVPGVETPYVFSEVFDLKPTSGLYPGSGVLVRSVGLQLPDRRISQPDLRQRVAALLGVGLEEYSASQMTYDLRRLRRKGIICRVSGSQRCYLTPYG